MQNMTGYNKEAERELVRLAYNSLPSSQTGAIFAAAILIFLLKDHLNLRYGFIWIALIILVAIIRVISYFTYQRSEKDTRFHKRIFLSGVILSSIGWLFAVLFLFPDASDFHQSFFALIFIMLATSTIGTLSSYNLAKNLFIISIMIPLAIRFYNIGKAHDLPITLGLIVYTVVLLISGRRLYNNVRNNIYLTIEAKERERRVRENEKRYEMIYDKSEDAMVVLTNYKIGMCNPAAVTLLGYNSRKHLLDTFFSDITPEIQLDGINSEAKARLIKNELKNTGFCKTEWTCKKLNGDSVITEVTATLVYLKDVISVFCVLRDITERIKMQKELHEAQQKAENANKAKSDFLANVSHEIRTPMNGVLGLTRLLLMDPLSGEQFKRARSIQYSAKAMLTILNDILNFSKLEAGKLDLNNSDFDLMELLVNTIAIYESGPNPKNLNFELNTPADMHLYYNGDSGKIRQILSNFIDNAYKFTEKGSISVKCILIEEKRHGSIIKFQVRDTGMGINKNAQKKIFKRFTQADESSNKSHGGFGLGLTICKQLSELMGGKIGFDSIEGHGSTFWFTVKLNRTNNIHGILDNIQIGKSTDDNITVKNQNNVKALVVDDNEINLEVAKSTLKLFDLDVELANSGEMAFDKLRESKFDIVFMDCQMPKLDGYQTTRIIRKSNIQIPIVAMTAYAMQEAKEKCIDSGMNDYITKPIDIDKIKDVLDSWVPQHSMQKVDEVNSESSSSFHNKEKLFDFTSLFERLGGNTDILKNVSTKFLNSAEILITEIEEYHNNTNIPKLTGATHKLKGSAANLSCIQLSMIAGNIETECKNKNLEKLELLIPLLAPCFQESRKEIESRLSGI